MKKKVWKQIMAIIIACTLVTGTTGSNTAFAAVNKKNITAISKPVKVNGKITKESSIAENIRQKERILEIDKILKKCEQVKTDAFSKEIRKGQMISVKSVSGNNRNKAAIIENGDLYCWGNNDNGQVGNGTTKDQTTPVKVLSNVKSVSISDSVSAITENGDLYCWGNNSSGQVGNGTTKDQTIPVKVLSNVKSVSISDSVSAITENGDLYCWGNNSSGQVGNGTTKDQTTPVKVLNDVKSVSVSGSYLVSAIMKNGDLYCWGNNSSGQVGNGTTKNQTTPMKVLSDVKSVSVASSVFGSGFDMDSFSVAGSVSAITENGDLYCWGNNSSGQVGNGTTKDQTIPVKVLNNVKSVSISISGSGSVSISGLVSVSVSSLVSAITENGDLYCWGNNVDGRIGNGTIKDQSTPIKVLSNVKSISVSVAGYVAGYVSGCISVLFTGSVSAIMENGDLYCWGDNYYGEVGNGTTKDQTTPTKVLSNVKFVSGSILVSAITENGDLYCWGYNNNGEVGNGTTKKQLKPIKVLSNVKSVFGSDFGSVSAITENGDLYCWGHNGYGQVGNGTTEHQFTPVKVLPIDNSNNDNITKFSITSSVSGELNDIITFSGSLVLPDNKEVSSDILDEEISNITWISGDTGIAEVTKCEGKHSSDNRSASLLVSVTPHKEGSVVITGRTSDGVTASCIVTVEEPVSSIDKSIAVFTTNKSMKIKTGKSMWLGFGLLDKNSDLLDDKWKKMSVVVSNPTIIGLSDYTEMEYGYSLEITGKKQGATNITITDTETGINTIITVSVQDDYADTYSYTIDNIAHFYPDNKFEKDIETNIYNLNGLYVNKYQCTKSTNSYNVSFDVYNSKYYSGAVDIYDENGMWTGYEEIEKYSDISSLWNTIEQTWYLVSDTVTGKMLTYEQASYSKHTHIDIEIPEGGYFTISNNVSESPGTFFINAFDILFNGVSALSDFLTDGIEDSALTKLKKEAKKTFATRLIEARNEGLKDNVKRTSQKIMLDSMKSKIKEITEENIKMGLKDKLKSTNIMCSNIVNLAEDMLSPQSFNIEWKSIFESTLGVGESFFYKFAGPAGIALEGCFALNDYANMILMATQMAKSAESPYVTIFSSIDTGYINPYGITVDTSGNIDAESVLQVFRVSNNDVIEILLDSDNPFENYELYNICFVKDDKLVQPSGKVTVQIPVPKGMKSSTCKVYRQEQGGAWTIIDAKVQGNYLVFETEHFSLYAVIGENDNLVISSLPKKINYKNGEILNTDGLVLDLNGQLITEGYICEPTVLSGNGKQFVKVIYGHSVTEFEVNVDKTEPPATSPSAAPLITPSPLPSKSPTPKPTGNPSGGSSSSGTTGGGGGGGFTGGGAAPLPVSSPVPSPSPSATPVTTSTPDQTQLPSITPEATITPLVTQAPVPTPDVMLPPSASPVTGEGNDTSSTVKFKKGLKVKDKKTKAVYKIVSTGKSKTAEYVKSTKKNTADIVIPVSVKLKGKIFKVVSIGNGAFKNNKKLKSVKIGKNIKLIGKEAFSGCKKLAKVKMGKNVTSIGTKAFNKCTSLTIITIPSKVKKIGKKAFYKCKNLQYILVKTKKLKPDNIGDDAFGNGYSNPRVKLDKSVWKQYQNVFISKGLSSKALFLINPAKLVV